MAEEANVLSRNPNVCTYCSSMADGLDETNPTECGDALPQASEWRAKQGRRTGVGPTR